MDHNEWRAPLPGQAAPLTWNFGSGSSSPLKPQDSNGSYSSSQVRRAACGAAHACHC